jgi:DNA-directed RNA polymerase subunit RPC12/RpoP
MKKKSKRYFSKCLRCDHEWRAYIKYPVACAKCNSHLWYEPKRELPRGVYQLSNGKYGAKFKRYLGCFDTVEQAKERIDEARRIFRIRSGQGTESSEEQGVLLSPNV